jgi:uridylate kinase
MKRILIKLSGEALANGSADGIYDNAFVDEVAASLVACVRDGYELAVVVGAGNIWRGRQGTDMDRVAADRMGMLATVINAICLKDAIERQGISASVMTSVPMSPLAEPYSSDTAKKYLAEGKIVIFGAGLGIPFVSTDTAAVVRAAEIGADIVLMAKNIDAIYTADPKKDKNAEKISNITYKEILARGLQAMDSTATSFAMDNNIPIHVFGLDKCENIYNVIMGAEMGTVVKGE